MIKAFFVDFYGTLVYEDGAIVKKITEEIFSKGEALNINEISSYWWNNFQDMCLNSFDINFETQRTIEIKSIKNTISNFMSKANADIMSEWMFNYWIKPDIFSDTIEFFKNSPIPIYIVSNIDRDVVLSAIKYHSLKPCGIITSEDAKCYKPREEIFKMALKKFGLKKDEVIHIGDSTNSDYKGASNVGIKALWLNRNKKKVPDGIESISNLLEAMDKIY